MAEVSDTRSDTSWRNRKDSESSFSTVKEDLTMDGEKSDIVVRAIDLTLYHPNKTAASIVRGPQERSENPELLVDGDDCRVVVFGLSEGQVRRLGPKCYRYGTKNIEGIAETLREGLLCLGFELYTVNLATEKMGVKRIKAITPACSVIDEEKNGLRETSKVEMEKIEDFVRISTRDNESHKRGGRRGGLNTSLIAKEK